MAFNIKDFSVGDLIRCVCVTTIYYPQHSGERTMSIGDLFVVVKKDEEDGYINLYDIQMGRFANGFRDRSIDYFEPVKNE
jgi:hypothetical protein